MSEVFQSFGSVDNDIPSPKPSLPFSTRQSSQVGDDSKTLGEMSIESSQDSMQREAVEFLLAWVSCFIDLNWMII